MKISLMLAFAAIALSGCVSDPVGAIQISDQAMAHCNYIGKIHGNGPYGGIGERAACIRYVRDTGNLPPAI